MILSLESMCMMTKARKLSEIYLDHFDSIESRKRAKYELQSIARLLDIDDIDQVNWQEFSRPNVLAMMSLPQVKERKPSSQNFTLRILKGLCTEAFLKGLMSESHLRAIKTVKSIRGERKNNRHILTHSEIRLIFQKCDVDGQIGVRDAVIFALAIGCGLRRAELVNLKIRDVDLQHYQLKIIGKGNKERIVFFNASVATRLKAWIDVRGERKSPYLLLPFRKGDSAPIDRQINDETVYHVIRSRTDGLLNCAVSPHDLRRYFASRLLEAQIDINTVRLALGHSDIRTTQIYDKRDEIERLRKISRVSSV